MAAKPSAGKLIGWPSVYHMAMPRAVTVPAFMDLFIKTGGTAGLQFSYDRSE